MTNLNVDPWTGKPYNRPVTGELDIDLWTGEGYPMSMIEQPPTQPTYRERLSQQINQGKQRLSDWTQGREAATRRFYGITDDVNPRSLNLGNAIKSGKAGFTASANPLTNAGRATYGGAALGGVMTGISSLAAGDPLGEAASKSAGATVLGGLGTAGGSAIGTALMPLVAATPLAPIAPFLPAIGGFIGGWKGTEAGSSAGGGIYNAITGNNDPEKEKFKELSRYAQFLSPDEQQSLANYLALTDAQSQISQRDALFTNDLATKQMRDMANINFDNDAAMSALNARIQAELDDRNNRYRMAENNTNNLWNGLAQAQNFAAQIYGA